MVMVLLAARFSKLITPPLTDTLSPQTSSAASPLTSNVSVTLPVAAVLPLLVMVTV